jgi:hypothetical protein
VLGGEVRMQGKDKVRGSLFRYSGLRSGFNANPL